MLKLHGIRKRYGRSWVLDGVDLTVASGVIAAVIGGNGSGKSTLLRIAVGASVATEGRTERPRKVGYVPERLPATLRMNAAQYLDHMGRIRGLDPGRARRRSTELLERLALVPGPAQPIGTLSKGNSQKVALAQAVMEPVELLVLDEPYSGLDEAAAHECTVLMHEARDRGAAVVVSAHQDIAVPDADLRCTLAHGRIETGAPGPGGMRVVLRAVSAIADAGVLAQVPGVESVRADGADVSVVTQDADGLLRVALEHGWSVREARR